MASVYLSSGLVKNKGADQSAHPRSLVSSFVIQSYLDYVAKETGLSLALSKHQRHVYFAPRPKFIILGPCFYSYSQKRFLLDVL